jgi:hypothetical protein
MRVGLHVKYPLFLSDIDEPWIFLKVFRKMLKYTRRETQIQTKLDQPPWKNGQHQTPETRPQLQTSRKKRPWTPQETMAMRRCRNRSNDLIHGGRWWWWLKYQSLWNSVRWDPSCSVGTSGRIGRRRSYLIVTSRNFANAPKMEEASWWLTLSRNQQPNWATLWCCVWLYYVQQIFDNEHNRYESPEDYNHTAHLSHSVVLHET